MIDELYARDAELVNHYTGSDVTFKIFKHPDSGSDQWIEDFTLAPSQIVSESMELKQSICDDRELKLGGCIPSQLQLDVMNIGRDAGGNRIDLSGKRIAVIIHVNNPDENLYPAASLYPAENLYPGLDPNCTTDYVLFIGQIYSYQKTSNRRISRIIAYDRLFYASTALCKQKMYRFLEQQIYEFPLSRLISTFFSEAKIKSGNLGSLVNYYHMISGYEEDFDKHADNKYTYLQLAQEFCEINGVFIVEDEPGENLRHRNAHTRVIDLYSTRNDEKYLISNYSNLRYDDFVTKPIRYFQFSSNEKPFYIERANSDEYGHYLSDNTLTQCLHDSDLWFESEDPAKLGIMQNIAERILGDVYVYRPFKASIFNRWWVQCGDRIKIPTAGDDDIPYVESIVLSRKIKGIRNIKVEIEAKGVETLGKEKDAINNE